MEQCKDARDVEEWSAKHGRERQAATLHRSNDELKTRWEHTIDWVLEKRLQHFVGRKITFLEHREGSSDVGR